MLGRTLMRTAVYPVADRLFAWRSPSLERELERFQWLDPETVRRHQWTRLARLLRHAYETTAHYRRILDEAGLAPADLEPDRLSPEAFTRLPILTKDALRAEFPGGIVSSDLGARKPIARHTSGTTQQALTIYKDPKTIPFERATHFWLNDWADLRRGDRLVYVSHYRRATKLRDRLWHILTGPRYFPSGPILERDGQAAADILDRRRPDGIFCSPPTMELLALALAENGRPLRFRPRAVVYHGALMPPAAQDLVRMAFDGVPLYSRYGAIEFGSWVAQTCPVQARSGRPAGENLHVNDFRYLAEVVGQDGAPLVPGEVGRLIVTNLANRITPIIRYDIGDLASLAPPGHCSCGRGLTTLQTLQGRHEDFVRFRSGRRVPAAYLYPPIRRYLGRWWEFQFAQTDPDHLVLSVVPKSPDGGFGPEGTRRLQEVLREALGEPMNVVIRIVDRIPFEPSGKRPFLKPLASESRVQRP